MPPHTVDIFCKVIDNYGDIGVAWRLARQLASEQGLQVRLWVDQLGSLARFCAAVDAHADTQTVETIEIRKWALPFPDTKPAEIVIETFGCDLPESYVTALAHQARASAWINLEYLSAESWVDGYHALPSPHPRLALAKYFYFPGFTDKTGGLLREKNLFAQRDAFQQDKDAQAELWRKLDLLPPIQNELRISLFCYENPALPALLQKWADGAQPITCLVPQGVAAESITLFFAQNSNQAPNQFSRGQLTMQTIPFTHQADYDQLLWACDINFVRGEDSFVRAQWAAKPFVWHIYPQKENAHWVKLNAFIDLYAEGLPDQAAAATRNFWRAFNAGRGADATWDAFTQEYDTNKAYTRVWAGKLAGRPDVATGLADFCRKLIK